MTLLFIIGFSLLGSVGVVLLSGIALLASDATITRFIPKLISFSTGSLLAAAFLGLLPHAAEHLQPVTLFGLVLLGLLAFFLLEKIMLWRHCHYENCNIHASTGPLLLLGDSFHNFGDGVVIATAFMASTPLGIVAALSTMAHEIPQEFGEFAVYLHAGYSRRKAFWLNLTTSLMTLLGALTGYFLFSPFQSLLPVVMALSAASFIYVALADLIPGQRGQRTFNATASEVFLLAAGVGMVYLLTRFH